MQTRGSYSQWLPSTSPTLMSCRSSAWMAALESMWCSQAAIGSEPYSITSRLIVAWGPGSESILEAIPAHARPCDHGLDQQLGLARLRVICARQDCPKSGPPRDLQLDVSTAALTVSHTPTLR